jgi:hypothetical protein
MKKIYSLLMVSVIALTANAQLVFLENFSGYTNGNLGVQGGWVQAGVAPDVQIDNASPLVYSGYTSGTQYAKVSNVNGTDPYKEFTSSINTSGNLTVYFSFVVRVSSAVATNGSPEYSVSLHHTLDTDRPLRFYIASEPGNTNAIRFGILTGNSTNVNNISWTSGTYATNSTHLIVIRYDITNAPGNQDDAYMWVDLANLGTEPSTASANATQLDANEANYGSILNAIEFHQAGANSPVADYDAFRVAYGATSAIAWFNLDPVGATLPVKLTSFNASEESFGTKLVWNTEEESGIVSYVIEKSTDGRNFTAIGTVKAANLRTYSFMDGQSSENSYYRLKMVELDGTYKYSYIVSVRAKLSTNISVSPNPVKSTLMIQHPKAGTTGHIQIFSSTGQLVRDIRLSANAVISNVDMSSFTNGMYHVIYKNGSDVFSKTVLKQ